MYNNNIEFYNLHLVCSGGTDLIELFSEPVKLMRAGWYISTTNYCSGAVFQ